MTTSPASDDILERLLTLHPKLVDLSLGRIERLLAALDHPERKLPPAVHVTGTNGKGSVLAFVRAMLEDAGYRVHVYISPHLARFHERIRLAGELISEPDLRDVLEHCERANGHLPITFFEITTAAAFVAFARTPADILLLENGLGGRLDATNVIERPLATAITPVSLDHQNFLGDTLAKIAFEKAGIIKRGVPCVLGPQPDEALKVIRARAGELSAPLIETPGGWTSERTPDGLTVTVGDKVLSLPAPVLAGPHQTANAGQAVALALALQGFELTEKNIAAGLANAQWPARLQRLKSGPVLDAVPADWEVWLDGGHNPSAGDAVSAHARAAWADRPLHLVTGMLESKDPRGFFRPFKGIAASVTTVTIPNEKAAIPADALAATAAEIGLNATPAGSVAAAVDGVVRREREPARLLICGSLYLAGAILREHA